MAQKLKAIDPYKHDCDKCQWVCWGDNGKLQTNIYICGETLIIRHSSEPSDYSSHMIQKGSKPSGMGCGNGLYFVQDEKGRYKLEHE